MKFLLFLFGLIVTHAASGQDVQRPEPSDLPPGTMRILCDVLSANQETASVLIIEVMGTGRAITNPVAQGDTVTIRTQTKPLKNARQKVVMSIREKQSVDASNTEFVLLEWKRQR